MINMYKNVNQDKKNPKAFAFGFSIANIMQDSLKYKQYLDLFFISSNLLITLITIKRILYSFNNLHNPNYSMFKTKTHNAYIIIMINKESYIKKKSHNDSIKNRYDSRRLQNFSKPIEK